MQWRSYKLAVFLENKILGTVENSDFAELYKMFNEMETTINKNEKLENKLKKIKIAKTISLIWMLFVMIVEIKIFIEDSTIFLGCLMGFAIWGILPCLILNCIYKIHKKEINKLT